MRSITNEAFRQMVEFKDYNERQRVWLYIFLTRAAYTADPEQAADFADEGLNRYENLFKQVKSTND